MIEPTGCVQCCAGSGTYCDRCDLLVGLPGLHVIRVAEDGPGLVVTVESPPTSVGCPLCGVIATSHGRRSVWLVDAPSFGRPVRIVWRKRTWRCREPGCPSRSFTEQDERISRPRGLLTIRACWWAISQLRTEHASVHGLARQLGTTWRTVWRSIEPLLQAMADDPARFDGVTSLGVDEHLVRHEALLVRMEVGDLDRFAVAAARWSWRQPVPGETLGSGGSSRDKVRAVRHYRTGRAW